MSDAPKHKRVGFWRDLGCEDDANEVWCPVRVGGLAALGFLFMAEAGMVALHGQFDPVAFGTAAAAIIGVIGAGAGIKAKLGG